MTSNRVVINANGSVKATVGSDEALDEALAVFVSQVKEAILIDGREYKVSFGYHAYETAEPDDGFF